MLVQGDRGQFQRPEKLHQTRGIPPERRFPRTGLSDKNIPLMKNDLNCFAQKLSQLE
jgi:hypothetical protein